VEVEVRELLSQYEFLGQTPIVIGSALRRWRGKTPSWGEVDLQAAEALDSYIPLPKRGGRAVPDAGGGRVLDLRKRHVVTGGWSADREGGEELEMSG